MTRPRAVIRVPASTSNLGPGFDCLGLAVQLYNTATVTRTNNAKAPHGMVAETAKSFFARVACGTIQPFTFEARIEGDIPVSRGLGSSVTVRLGILLGLAELVRDEVAISRQELLDLLIELEGHPDNAVASLLGGFAVCSPASALPSEGFSFTRVEVKPMLSFVTLVPELKLSTETARGLLPKEIPLRQAVENAQRTARIAACFCTGEYASLRGLFVDHVHQPFRQVLIPGFGEILGAATKAGALGTFLSGAGSCLMAVTLDNETAIADAMMCAARKHALPARAVVLKADNAGATVLESA